MKNYKRKCGCIYGEEGKSLWYACVKHAGAQAIVSADESWPWWLYTLRLQDNKFYVGITHRNQPYDRIHQHGGPLGAQWTKLHKPVELIELRRLDVSGRAQAEIEEQKQTLKLMNCYGHANVRGGALTYRGGYTKFLNRYFRDYEWRNFVSTAIAVGFLLIVILYLALK